MTTHTPTKTAYLNVGCGGRFHKGEPWINLDVASNDTSVMSWDARAGLPVETNSFDVVYLSHVLEHFSEKDGARLVAECHRVLKAGGTLRVVVPDLEGICREYLRNLEEVRSVPPGHPDRLSWIKLELLDQCTRHQSGGSMRTFFPEHGLNELDYVVGRIGTVGIQLAKPCTLQAAKRKPIKLNWSSLRTSLRDALLSPEEAEALRIGQFRLQGEPHLWMYESVTLEQLLRGSGFSTVEFHRADTSRISDWDSYHLDRDPDGRGHAPSSLYAEGTK
jgi:predicted SAM-dependent methyltransferase